ncbi:MAG: glycosyltransferase family 2 protein [Candidatus Bathyarchaeota archaeon]|nr:glycosyltransferase family 2 protein [Candidatus Bathyarchaeota archaeon]
MIGILEAFFVFLTGLMIVFLVRHYIFTLTVLRRARKAQVKVQYGKSDYEPTVTILVPARNEENVLGRLLQRLTEVTYPKNKMQIIVIDDASTDKTGQIAKDFSNRHAFIEVLQRRQSEGGKGKTAAMNAGFGQSKGEITLCFDADYYPQRDIVENLVRPFEDPKVGAVQGRVVVLNEPQNTVTRLVALERIGGYRVDQEARDNLGLIAQFGGTVGGFRRSLLESLGGWDENILAEDTDLTFRVALAGYRIRYVGDAECYEEAVDNWQAYFTQRYRWAKGHMQCCWKHSFSVLKSKKLGVACKIDGLLLLNVYFMPLLVLISIIVGVPLILLHSSPVASALWFSVPIALYSFVGNFAPFFEVGIGAHLDGRQRIQWLLPLLVFTFLYNVLICVKAFMDLLGSKIMRRNHSPSWAKTHHLGTGNYYIADSPTKREVLP